MTVKVRVPATSANLGPGYDSIGLALQIYNELTLSVAEGKQSTVEITGEGALSLPRDGSHLSLKAADLLFERAGEEPPAWRLHQHNRVPPASGLGSSAAAIVGGLFAANAFLPRPFSREQLLDLRWRWRHPTMWPSAIRGAVISPTGTVAHLRCPLQRAAAAAGPADLTLSTGEARRVLPADLRSDAVFNLGRAASSPPLCSRGRAALNWPWRIGSINPIAASHPRSGGGCSCRGGRSSGAALSGAGPTVVNRFEPGGRRLRADKFCRHAERLRGRRCGMPDHLYLHRLQWRHPA